MCGDCSSAPPQGITLSAGQIVKTLAGMPVSAVITGLRGKTEVTLGINQASETCIRLRLDFCRVCEHATKNPDPRFAVNQGLTNRSRCTLCTCRVLEKVKWRKSKCPDKPPKWGPCE
jgi:hypothetical protein